MTRAGLLAASSKRLGAEVPDHVLRYCLRSGKLRPAKRLPDGWLNYTQGHVEDLVDYCRTRSHRRAAV